MKDARPAVFLAWGLLAVLLLLQGCVSKMPKTIPLAEDQKGEAERVLAAFLREGRPQALDADIKLGWDFLAGKGTAEAIVQVQQPAFLRLSLPDPLGRAMVLVASDGKTFTMVDNRAGKGYQGSVDSKFWHSYVPPPLAPEDLFPLLGGFLSQPPPTGMDMFSAERQTGFWYVWKEGPLLVHRLLIDRSAARLIRHLVIDGRGDTLLDVRYSDFHSGVEGHPSWPHLVEVEGAMITGTLTVQIVRVVSYDPLPPARFYLSLPSHYTLEQVD